MAHYAAASSSAAVDWRLVDQELSRVPGEFKDPKFYALKHVVDILTAEDPRALVSQLRDQEEVLADLVDGMVQGYHSGFAKSIQNYSQILQLFGEAKDQVVGLKKALADASRQLSAQSRTLQQQWRKSLALESSLQLLDSIQLVAAAPEAIDRALAAKEWSSAVSLLMEACSKLVGNGIAKVGALRRLKADMVTVSLMLEAQLLQELHSRVYLPTAANSPTPSLSALPPPPPAAAAAATAGGGSNGCFGGSSGGQRTDSPSRLGAQQQQQQQLLSPVKRALAKDAAGGKDNLSRLSAAGPAGSSSSSSSMPAFVLDALASDSAAAAATAAAGSSSSAASILRGSAAGGGRAAAAAAAAGTVGELVTCLMLLDGLDDAKLYLLLHARAGVRQMILRVVEAWAQQQEAAVQAGSISISSISSRTGGRLGAYGAGSSGSPVRGMGGLLAPTQGTAAKDAWTVPPAVQLSAQQLLSAVFDACLKALANMGVLLQVMIDTSTATSSSSSSSRSKGGSSSSRAPGSPLKHSSAGGNGGQQHSAAALQTLKQQQAAQQQHHHRSGSSGGGSGTAAAAAIAATPAPTAAGAAAAGAALDPLVALQSMQSGLLPASSVSFAAGIAASLGATVASGGSSMLYGPNGLATGTIQGLEWAKATGRTPIGLLKTQCAHLWQEMQAEVLLLLGELLRAVLRGGGAGAPQGAARQGGWLADFAELGARAGGQLLSAAGTAAAAAAGAGGSSSGSTAGAATAAGSGGGSCSVGPSSGSVTGGGAGGFSGGGAQLGSGGQTGSNLMFRFDLSASELTPDGGASSVTAMTAAGAGGSSGAAAAAAAAGVGVASAAAAGGGGGADVRGYGSLLKRGFGSSSTGGPYLTPAVYLAVNHFVDNALVIIADACAMPPPTAADSGSSGSSASILGGGGAAAAAAGGGGGSAGGSFSSPPSSGGSAAGFSMDQQSLDGRLRSVWLRQSVGEFVLEGFLPQLWVDLRGRCTAALEDPEAFKPQPVGHAGLAGFMARSAAGAGGGGTLRGASATAAAAASSGGSSSSSGSARIRPPQSAVPAAGFACQVLQEVMAWMPAIPLNAAGILTGILEAILSRVLESLAEQVAGCLGGAKAGSMALRPSLALVMATEPDAILLAQDDPAAFYVPLAHGGSASAAASAADAGGVLRLWGQAAAFEGYEGFLKSLKSADKPVLVPGHHRPYVKVRGLGLEGESAAEEVLLLCHREAAAGSQLLSLTGSRAAAGGLVTLAAFAESADWVADYLAHMAANSGPGGSLAPGSWLGRHSSSKTAAAAGSTGGRLGGSKGGGQQSNLGRGIPGGGLPRSAGGAAAAAAGGSGEAAVVSRALLMLSHRYRSLAGVCCRVLRLDLLLLAGHQLQVLGSVSHLCEEEDVMEVHPCIGSLSRVASRAAEEVSPHLSPRKRSYVCGAVAVAAARSMMWVLQDIPDMNALGVERMIRGLALLQGPLGSLGAAAPGAAGGPSADVVRAYDRAKSFYTLVGLPPSEVVLLAADRPGRYSLEEWESLLQVRVPGRPCDQTDMAALHRALDKHYHLSTGQKVADFFEDVRHTVQVPVQSFTGNVSAGFKGGFTQAKALLNKAAGAVSDAAAATATSVSTAAAKARTGGGSAAAGSTGGSTGTQ